MPSPYFAARIPPLTIIALVFAIPLFATNEAVAQSCSERQPTRITGPGPHDFSYGVSDPVLWRDGDGGEPLVLRGRVLDTCGKPVANALVRIVHANENGDHIADRWRAHLNTDASGQFRVVTVLPGYTAGLPRHMHFIIEHPEHRRLMTHLYFKNDPLAEPGAEDLSLVLEEVQREDRRGWLSNFEFVLEGTGG